MVKLNTFFLSDMKHAPVCEELLLLRLAVLNSREKEEKFWQPEVHSLKSREFFFEERRRRSHHRRHFGAPKHGTN